MFAAWLPNTRWVGRTHHGWSHRCSTCSPSGTGAWLSCQARRAAWVGRPRSGSCTTARPSGRASAPSHGQQPSGPSSTTDTLAQNLPALIGTSHTLPRFGDEVTDLPVSQTYIFETATETARVPPDPVSLTTVRETPARLPYETRHSHQTQPVLMPSAVVHRELVRDH